MYRTHTVRIYTLVYTMIPRSIIASPYSKAELSEYLAKLPITTLLWWICETMDHVLSPGLPRRKRRSKQQWNLASKAWSRCAGSFMRDLNPKRVWNALRANAPWFLVLCQQKYKTHERKRRLRRLKRVRSHLSMIQGLHVPGIGCISSYVSAQRAHLNASVYRHFLLLRCDLDLKWICIDTTPAYALRSKWLELPLECKSIIMEYCIEVSVSSTNSIFPRPVSSLLRLPPRCDHLKRSSQSRGESPIKYFKMNDPEMHHLKLDGPKLEDSKIKYVNGPEAYHPAYLVYIEESMSGMHLWSHVRRKELLRAWKAMEPEATMTPLCRGRFVRTFLSVMHEFGTCLYGRRVTSNPIQQLGALYSLCIPLLDPPDEQLRSGDVLRCAEMISWTADTTVACAESKTLCIEGFNQTRGVCRGEIHVVDHAGIVWCRSTSCGLMWTVGYQAHGFVRTQLQVHYQMPTNVCQIVCSYLNTPMILCDSMANVVFRRSLTRRQTCHGMLLYQTWLWRHPIGMLPYTEIGYYLCDSLYDNDIVDLDLGRVIVHRDVNLVHIIYLHGAQVAKVIIVFFWKQSLGWQLLTPMHEVHRDLCQSGIDIPIFKMLLVF